MRHIVSFSGGRTSAYLVNVIEETRKSKDWNVTYVFMDTGAEHPATYDFIRNVVDYFGIELVTLKCVINPELGKGTTYRVVSIDDIGYDLTVFTNMVNKYGNPYIPGGNFCTDQLKSITYRKWVDDHFKGEEITSWIGIRIDEKRRLKKKPNVRYLAELSAMEKPDIIGWWKEMPFDLETPEHMGNCMFCIHKQPSKLALGARDMPKHAEEWMKMAESARVTKPDLPAGNMYRHKKSLRQIVATFSDIETEVLRKNIEMRGGYDTEACTESCEANFGEQIDFFEIK